MKTPYLLAIAWFLAIACTRQTGLNRDTFIQKADALFEDWSEDQPGGAVAIIAEGEVIYESYFGLENLETQLPFSAQTHTDIGSVSKQFTAYLIAVLADHKLLSIEDDIRKFLPEIPFYGDTVKVKHLLLHTSGIKDYEALVMIKGAHYFDAHMTNSYVMELMSAQQSLNFSPGSHFEYSNSNYILLSQIIERLSGKPLAEFAEEQIFAPLGMNHTAFRLNQGDDFVHKAIGYVPSDSGYSRPVYRSHLIGDGGIFTSLPDMIKWDSHFYSGKQGNKAASLLQQMKYREPLSDGSYNSMAFAQIFTTHPFGQDSWSHGGSGGGYRSFYIRFEEAGFSVIVLTNSDSHNAFEKANMIVDLFFDYRPEAASTPADSDPANTAQPPFIPINQDIVDHFTGSYHDKAGISAVSIRLDDKEQHFIVNWLENNDGGYPSLPINPSTLAEKEDRNYRYVFNQHSNLLIHTVGEQAEKSWMKLAPVKMPITAFEGSYFAEEVNHMTRFSLQGKNLGSQTPFLTSLIRIGDVVFYDEHAHSILSFEIDAKGEVRGFTVDIPRGDRSLRNLRFEKKE